ncbi:MAG: hypothetical protein JWO96_825 [Candidatus Saccharibacteria bacterium]|nr:hypothetical protein [Candidatus Saccharibacteria bacterium]
MSEFSIGSFNPNQNESPYFRVYFREDPESLVEPDIEDLKEALDTYGISVLDLDNSTGKTYIVDCHTDGLAELKELMEEYGFWVSMIPNQQVYL